MHHAEEVDEQMDRKINAFHERMTRQDDHILNKPGAEKEAVGETPGPTGEFPDGKLTELDEGEIRIAAGIVEDKVVMDFGTPVTWIGMDRDQAHTLGRRLMKLAKKLK
jgi:hypothetical protein